MQNTDNVRPETLSLPKGGGAITGLKGDVAGAGPDGANALSIPLPINPGRGYAPSLSLSYYSRSGNGPFGMGWSVDNPAIRRRTKKGVPHYNDTDEFLGPNGEVIVPFLADDGTASTRTASALLGVSLGSDFTVHRYRYRIETDFSRLEYWVGTGSGGRDFWVQYTPDGQLYLFGCSSLARISDPATPENAGIWLLESSVSATGEQIYWSYRAEDETGCEASETTAHPNATAQRYLAAVYYGNRVAARVLAGLTSTPALTDWLFMAVFDYGERPADATTWIPPDEGDWASRQDCFSSWEYGFELRTRRLCRQILTYHFTGTLGGSSSESVPQLVSRFALSYTETPMVTTLIGVQQSGLAQNGIFTSLPKVEFAWSIFDPTANGDPWPENSWQERKDLANTNSLQPYQLMDLNGEGVAGILYQDSGAWWYRAPIRQQGGDANAVTWDKPTPLPTIPALRDSGVLADLNGDGYMEWVVTSAGVNGYYSRTPERGWLNFTPLSAYPVEYLHPRAMLVDITGAGLADLALIGPKSVRLYAGTGDGWEKALNVIQPTGVTLPVPGIDERVLVAFSDMAGSGQQHLVEIKKDSVQYWPNHGHGKFGAPITMENWQVPADVVFNPAQVFLADIDGSGTTDVIYALSKKVVISINQSGNSFAEPFEILFPEGVRFDNTCELQVADIQGLGVASLVLTVPHPVPHHYVCHLTAVKPWLLNQMRNNMGAQHDFTYRSSAQFWLDEKQQAAAAGKPVPASYLPFALHLLSRTDLTDNITGNHLVSTARYLSGTWDGKEREFRGFGFVELQDTDTLTSQGTSTEISQPSMTRHWFATGLAAVDDRLPDEWWSGDDGAFDRFAARFTSGYGDNEQLYAADDDEAFWLRRATKGMLLRSELYGLDGSDAQSVPYQVSESRPQVRLVAAAAEGGYPIVLPLTAETRTYTYERISNDPQCSQQITLTHDQYGQPLYTAIINYPRRAQPATSPYPDTLPETLFDSSYDDQQQQLVITCQENHWYGIDDMASGIWVNGLFDLSSSYVYLYSSAPDTGLTLEQISRTGAPLGTPASQAFSGMQENWYLNGNNTPTSEQPAFPPRVGLTSTAILDQETVTALKEDLTDSVLQQAGYIWYPYFSCWVVHRNITTYGTAEHFWLPQTVRDSDLTGAITLTHDAYDCVVTKVVDAAGLTTQAEYDWRFLTPVKITDVNNNIHQVTLDGLGRVTSQRFSGTENGVAAGYSDTDFTPPTDVDEALALTPPLPVAQCLVYVSEGGGSLPPHVLTLTTDRYDQGDDTAEQQIRQTVSFSDGFGRELQTSVRFEAGEAWQRADDGTLITETAQTSTRWAISGRTEYDNKGQAIRAYQPYFLDTWRWVVDDSARTDLYADTHYFDPLGREREVFTAKGYLRRTMYTPWFVVSEDENDLADIVFASAIDLTVLVNDAVADGVIANSVKATVYDQHGNPLADQRVTFSIDSDVHLELLSPTTDEEGSVSAELTSFAAGQYTLTASCGGRSRSVTMNFEAWQPSTTLSTFTASTTLISVGGEESATLTLVLKDEQGTLLSGQDVVFISDVAGATMSAVRDNQDGSYTARFSSRTSGAFNITVTVNGNELAVPPVTIAALQPASMPEGTYLAVNGVSFALDEFPNTGLIGVKFQVVMAGDAATNRDYNWSVDQAWLTVDEEGYITITGTADELTRSVKVTAASIADGNAYVWRFTLSHWFATLGEETMTAPVAVDYAANNGWTIPSIPDLFVMVDGEAQRVAGPHLWSEWGNLSVYPGTGVPVGTGRFYWLQETVEVYLEQMHLTTTLTTIDNTFPYVSNGVVLWVLLMKEL
ncbi:SpvB/TcaC N-terminal domain-containing protein [Kosakonia sacchari]|uniref:SpvB/TcaC N-terminal domain-containing protein n=1 Tax=Kosakonia sacchari TaxID=1158459 RepID=UPI00338EE660